jgi:mannosyltransferase OCH1-like enzyme
MIPKTFHRIWVGPAMPAAFVRYGETWKEHHPDWEMILWNEKNMPELVNQKLYDEAPRIFPGFEGQLRSDIARYEILHRYGGVYIDTDFECLKPIDELIEGVGFFCAWEIQGKVANNAILGCTPGHPFAKVLVDELEESVRRQSKTWPAKASGPHYLTAKLREGVTVFDKKLFYEVGCTELDRLTEPYKPDEYARHYWNNQHRIKKRPLPPCSSRADA